MRKGQRKGEKEAGENDKGVLQNEVPFNYYF